MAKTPFEQVGTCLKLHSGAPIGSYSRQRSRVVVTAAAQRLPVASWPLLQSSSARAVRRSAVGACICWRYRLVSYADVES